MIILISGLPGTGKTFIGDHLADHNGFRHLDLESRDGQALIDLLQQQRFDDFVREVAPNGEDVVLTFGYPPELLPVIEQLGIRGIKPIWLDAPILFSRRNWRPEPRQDPRSYGFQMAKIIDAHDRLDAFYANKKICVCNKTADSFLPVNDIAELILTVANG
jgi:hypothetical protein